MTLADRTFKAVVIRSKRNHFLKIKGKYDDNDSISRKLQQRGKLYIITK